MTEICNDNRFELIEKYKNKLLENTNIADSKEEMDVIDNILFRFWQMGWFDKLEQFDYQKEEIKNLRAKRYRMTDNEIIKALDILEKFDFFEGQRAGRELWSEKPTEVQDEDIKSFSRDVAFLKDLIDRKSRD